jgi:hypothetical protein
MSYVLCHPHHTILLVPLFTNRFTRVQLVNPTRVPRAGRLDDARPIWVIVNCSDQSDMTCLTFTHHSFAGLGYLR